eukprot:jgi/Bigna1/83373/fgenesh1_pg.107_\
MPAMLSSEVGGTLRGGGLGNVQGISFLFSLFLLLAAFAERAPRLQRGLSPSRSFNNRALRKQPLSIRLPAAPPSGGVLPAYPTRRGFLLQVHSAQQPPPKAPRKRRAGAPLLQQQSPTSRSQPPRHAKTTRSREAAAAAKKKTISSASAPPRAPRTLRTWRLGHDPKSLITQRFIRNARALAVRYSPPAKAVFVPAPVPVVAPSIEGRLEKLNDDGVESIKSPERETLQAVIMAHMLPALPAIGTSFFAVTKRMPGDQVKVLVLLLATMINDSAFKILLLHIEGCLPHSVHKALVQYVSKRVSPSTFRIRAVAGMASRALPKRVSRNLVGFWLRRAQPHVLKRTAMKALTNMNATQAEWLIDIAHDHLRKKTSPAVAAA